MTSVGMISLVMGCVFLYIYQTRIKGGSSRKLRNAEKLRDLQDKSQAQQGDELSIEDVGSGGVIHLDGVGVRSESFDAQVTARHLHKRGTERWIELEADRGGSTVYLSLERDDGLTASLTMAQPALKALGLKAVDLDALSDERPLTYDGTAYAPSEYGRAVFCRDHNELKPEEYEYWEFEDDDQEQYLTLVRWQDGSVEANYSVDLKPDFITVYSRS